MNILIEQNNEIKKHLIETEKIVRDIKLTKPIINKIKIINDQLLEISKTLTNLNINIKKNNQIILNKEEQEYLDCEKKSNILIAKIMPTLAIFSLHN